MKKNLLFFGLALAGLYLYKRSKNKSITTADLQKQPSLAAGTMPSPGDSVKSAVEKNTGTGTISANFVSMPRVEVQVKDIRVLKKPIYIRPVNQIPNVYDRGVGLDVNATGANGHANSNEQKAFNVSGICSENVQKACQCADKGHGKYKLDIPSLY